MYIDDFISTLKIKPLACDIINNAIWSLFDTSNNDKYRVIIDKVNNDKYNICIQYVYTEYSEVNDMYEFTCHDTTTLILLINAVMSYLIK